MEALARLSCSGLLIALPIWVRASAGCGDDLRVYRSASNEPDLGMCISVDQETNGMWS